MAKGYAQSHQESDPFAPAWDEGFHFDSAELDQRLNLIQHLTEYSRLLLVVTGEQGSGKSHLIDRLLSSSAGTWRVCVVEADPELTQARILTRLGRCLDLPERHTGVQDPEQTFQAYLASAARGGRRLVVIVDDAHLLPPEGLRFLLGLARRTDVPAPRLLLFGEPLVQEMVERETQAGENLSHVIDIPPLTRPQVEEYVRARLGHAHMGGRAALLDEDLVQCLYTGSKGLPGAINLAARGIFEVARDSAATARTGESPVFPRGLDPQALWRRLDRRQRLTLAVMSPAFLLLVGWLLWPAGGAGPPPDGERLPLPPRPEPREPMAYAPADTAPVSDQATVRPLTTAPESVARQDMAPVPGATPPPEGGVIEAEVPAAPRTGRESIQAHAREAAEPERTPRPRPVQPAAAPAPLAAAAPPPPPPPRRARPERAPEPAGTGARTPAKPRAPARSSTKSGARNPASVTPIKGKKWLRGQAPAAYTVQLIGSRERKAALSFIERHGLRARAAWFRTEHKGNPWYVVVMGVYTDRDSAVRAVRELPPALRKRRPWPRTFGSIQQGLR